MRIALVAVVALALGGAAHAASVPPLRPPRPAVPDGYRVRRLAEAGFAVAFPAGWQLLERRDAAWPGASQTLARFDRSLAPYLAALAVPDSPLKLFGFDRRRPAARVTVLMSRGAGPHWARGALRAVRALPGVRGLASRRLRIAAGDALLLRYEQGRVATLQLVVPRGSQILTLTLTAPAASPRRYDALFLAVARTLDTSVQILHP